MLDPLDQEILRLLGEDARRSHREIARLTGSTQPTVTSRIRRLEDAGLIKGYTVRLDEEAFHPTDPDQVRVVCHWCRQRTAEPLWATVDGRGHPFCCPTCRAAYLEKHARLSKGL